MAESVSSREILPFIYTVDISITALSGTGTKTLVLGSDSEFELYGFEARTNMDMVTTGAIAGTTSASNPVQAPDNFKILIKDISTGRDLFTNSLSRSLVCGNSSNLFVPEGYKIRFPRQNQLQFDFTNLYTAWPTASSQSLDITFALRGYKIFGRMG